MNRKQKIIVSITGIFIVLLALVGLTYGYFLTRIQGNTNNKSISITTANLALVYRDGSPELLTSDEPIIPGKFESSKTFTVTNEGNAKVDSYGVYLEDFSVIYANDGVDINGRAVNKNQVTSFNSPTDMNLVVTCKSVNAKTGTETGTCSGIDGTLPTTNDLLFTSSIDVGIRHEYTLTLTYLETGLDQSADMNKTINGKIQIYNEQDVVNVEGTVTGANTGDYVQINSVQKISQIVSGKYVLTGIEPGTHTLAVYSKDKVLRGSTTLTINKGKNNNVSGSTITITDEAESVAANITSINADKTLSINIDDNIKESSPFTKGTLAYSVYENPLNNKNTGDIKYNLIDEIKNEYKIKNGESGTFIAYDPRDTFATYATSYEMDQTTGTFKLINAQYGEYNREENVYLADFPSIYQEELPTTGLTTIYKATSKNQNNCYDDSCEMYYETLMIESEGNTGIINVWPHDTMITYGNSYEFDEKTGTFKLLNTEYDYLNSSKENIYLAKIPETFFEEEQPTEGLKEIYKLISKVENDCSDNCPVSYMKITSERAGNFTIPGKETSIESEKRLGSTIDDYGISYYYRGNVDNNYLNYSGMCWRIVRIQGNGTVKLVLADEEHECGLNTGYSVNNEQSAFIGDSVNQKFKYYVGYDYKNSLYKTALEAWANGGNYTYNEAFTETEKTATFVKHLNLNKVEENEWCSDISMSSQNDNYEAFYGSYKRLNNIETATPSLKCDFEGTENTKSQKIKSVVGMLTADEMAFAGATFSEANNNHYLHQNAVEPYWTISPAMNFDDCTTWMWIYSLNGNLFVDNYGDNYNNINTNLRPSIVLKASSSATTKTDTKTYGMPGTINNPYVVN